VVLSISTPFMIQTITLYFQEMYGMFGMFGAR